MVVFSEDQNVLTSDLTSIPCITHHIEPQCHPPRSAHARCLENLRVDLTLARPPVFAEKLSATHQLAWRICFKNAFFGEKRPFFWSGRFWKKRTKWDQKNKKHIHMLNWWIWGRMPFTIIQSYKSECNLNASWCFRATSHAWHSPKTLTKVSMSDSKQTYQGWFQGLPIMGPPFDKLPILFPSHSHHIPISLRILMGVVWK